MCVAWRAEKRVAGAAGRQAPQGHAAGDAAGGAPDAGESRLNCEEVEVGFRALAWLVVVVFLRREPSLAPSVDSVLCEDCSCRR